MRIGAKRTLIARIIAGLGVACGLIGFLGGPTDKIWNLGATEWFTGGTLLALIALVILVDGAIAYQKAQEPPKRG
jgi:hypothetical protein